MSKVGFIGPGIMGAPMIANLVRAGHQVRALGRSARSVERAAQAGADRAATLDEVVEGAETIITMLPDSDAVSGLVLGGDQAAGPSGAPLVDLVVPGQVFVDMSTISAAVSRTIAMRMRDEGVSALDAPVSGGEAGAIEGTLSVMVGGDEAAVEVVRPILEAMAKVITFVGPSGSGQLTKAANQLVVASNIAAVAEAIVFLEHAGVDVDAALSAISGGLAGSTVLERKRASMLDGRFEPGFRISLHDKDLRILKSAAEELNLYLPVARLVTKLMASALARGDGELDHSALLRLTRALNGTCADTSSQKIRHAVSEMSGDERDFG